MRDFGRIRVFAGSVSSNEKRLALQKVAESGRNIGLDCSLQLATHYAACDVAVVWGLAKQAGDDASDERLARNAVFANHRGPTVIIEAPVVGRKVPPRRRRPWWVRKLVPRRGHILHSLIPSARPTDEVYNEFRIGIDGGLGDDGGLALAQHCVGRWAGLAQRLSLPSVAPYRRSGSNVVVVGQVPGDASLRGLNIDRWIIETCKELRSYTDRPILIRLHPRARQSADGILEHLTTFGVALDNSARPFTQTLQDAWVVVTYSSGASIDALLAGVPAIALSSASYAWEVTDHALNKVNEPTIFAREAWLEKIAAIQWSDKELADGVVWEPILRSLSGRLAMHG